MTPQHSDLDAMSTTAEEKGLHHLLDRLHFTGKHDDEDHGSPYECKDWDCATLRDLIAQVEQLESAYGASSEQANTALLKNLELEGALRNLHDGVLDMHDGDWRPMEAAEALLAKETHKEAGG